MDHNEYQISFNFMKIVYGSNILYSRKNAFLKDKAHFLIVEKSH